MILQKAGRSVLAAAALVCFVAGALAQVPTSKHVILVINENTSYNDVMANMPWLTGEGNTHTHRQAMTEGAGVLLDPIHIPSGMPNVVRAVLVQCI